jgi:8-oxo-dGTP diphosphatase
VVEIRAPILVDSFTIPHGGRDRRHHKAARVVFSATIAGGTLGTTDANGSTDFAEWVPLHRLAQLEHKAGIVDATLAAIVASSEG